MKLISFLPCLFFVLALSLVSNNAAAQDFVYEPKNPAFGGNFYNYQWMLSSAQAQNSYKAPADEDKRNDRDALADFQQSLNRQILNQLSSQLITSQFGEGGIQEGQYIIGNYQIDVAPGTNGVNIVILDVNTGSQTTVTIPFVQ